MNGRSSNARTGVPACTSSTTNYQYSASALAAQQTISTVQVQDKAPAVQRLGGNAMDTQTYQHPLRYATPDVLNTSALARGHQRWPCSPQSPQQHDLRQQCHQHYPNRQPKYPPHPHYHLVCPYRGLACPYMPHRAGFWGPRPGRHVPNVATCPRWPVVCLALFPHTFATRPGPI